MNFEFVEKLFAIEWGEGKIFLRENNRKWAMMKLFARIDILNGHVFSREREKKKSLFPFVEKLITVEKHERET